VFFAFNDVTKKTYLTQHINQNVIFDPVPFFYHCSRAVAVQAFPVVVEETEVGFERGLSGRYFHNPLVLPPIASGEKKFFTRPDVRNPVS